MQHSQKKLSRPALLMRILCVTVLTMLLVISNFDPSMAAQKRKAKSAANQDNPLYSALVIDANTGAVLMARNADSIRHPASLTKIMTLYMVFDALKSGQLKLDDRIPISERAAGMSPSKIGQPAGTSIRVEDAIKAIVTKSANDISAAVAEHLGGTERAFAAKMTKRAKSLGMTRTIYRNASGLPDPQQVTTARDQAKLAIAMLRDHKRYYGYFSLREFSYRGVTHRNHNRLLNEYEGMDGIKTGFINASGFNLVASAARNGRRLIGVVFGGKSWRSRNDHMVKLLDAGFEQVSKRTDIREASINPEGPVQLPPPMIESATDVVSNENDDDADGETLTAPAQSQAIETRVVTNAEVAASQTYTYATTAALEPSQTTAPSQIIRAERMEDAPQQTATAETLPVPTTQPREADRRATALRTIALHQARGTTTYISAVDTKKMVTAKPEPAHKDTSRDIIAAYADIPSASSAETPRPPKVPSTGAGSSSAPTLMQLRIPRGSVSSAVQARAMATGWAVQVGAFQSRALTDQAIRTAIARLPASLQTGRPVIVPQQTQRGMVFRGRLQGFNEKEAYAACSHLGSCLVVAPGS